MSEASEQLQKALDEAEDYQQTVKALIAFAAFVVHDGHQQRPGAEFGFGRRMTTSTEGAVTPDLVAQKSDQYGIAAEAKKSLPRDQKRWSRSLKQLRKYDDDLTGWWTDDESIPASDAVMLVHQSRGRSFCRFLKQAQAEDPDSVGENTSVVEFNSSAETASYYFFRLEHGTVRDEELEGRLQDGIQVPLDKLVKSFPTVRYYDSRPPLAILLADLWMDMFPSLAEDAEYDEKYKATRIPVSVTAVTDEMQKAFGSGRLLKDKRSVEFPRHRWIKDAFEKLVEFKMAFPPSEGADVYQILFKGLRGNVRERFIQMDLKSKRGEKEAPDQGPFQTSLFDEEEAGE